MAVSHWTVGWTARRPLFLRPSVCPRWTVTVLCSLSIGFSSSAQDRTCLNESTWDQHGCSWTHITAGVRVFVCVLMDALSDHLIYQVFLLQRCG